MTVHEVDAPVSQASASFSETQGLPEGAGAEQKTLFHLVPVQAQAPGTCGCLFSRVDPKQILPNLLAMDKETGLLSRFFSVPRLDTMNESECLTCIEDIQARLRAINFHLPSVIRSHVPANVMVAKLETLKAFLQCAYDFDLSVALADVVPGAQFLESVSTAEACRYVITRNAERIRAYVDRAEPGPIESLVLNPEILPLFQAAPTPWRALHARLFCLPSEVCKVRVRMLSAGGGNVIHVLPSDFRSLTEATHICLENNQLRELSSGIQFLVHLKNLDVSLNRLSDLPSEIGLLTSLETIELSGNQLSALPGSIVSLENLQVLNVSENCLVGLPQDFSRLQNLQTLSLSGNRFTEFPRELFGLPALRLLRINQDGLLIPKNLGVQIPSLQRIAVRVDLPTSEIPTDFEIASREITDLILQRKR